MVKLPGGQHFMSLLTVNCLVWFLQLQVLVLAMPVRVGLHFWLVPSRLVQLGLEVRRVSLAMPVLVPALHTQV